MTPVKPDHPILVVEDSPEDYEAMIRAFKKAGLDNPVWHCAHGDEALDFLYHRGVYADKGRAPRPVLILLDLNLPGTDGREVLAQIKQDDDLKEIPVVVFTTSSYERDVEACYRAGANSYVQKPVGHGRFIEAIGRLRDFWFDLALLPTGVCPDEQEAAQHPDR